jgi:hypothetical protein
MYISMIKINGHDYKLCLLDTNALSNLLKEPQKWLTSLERLYSLSNTVICYSIFTLSELYQKIELFDRYLEIFSQMPSCILDGFQSIYEKELSCYSNDEVIQPIVLCPFAIIEPNLKPKERLLSVIEKSVFTEKTNYWINSREEVLKSIVKLKENYPPKSNKYSLKEIDEFVFIASSSQIMLRSMNFAKSLLDNGKSINVDKFPSIKMTSLVVFYKLYPDNRTPILSDVIDIIISSVIPYVDIVITENNLSHIINILKTKHGFLDKLENNTVRNIMRNFDNA